MDGPIAAGRDDEAGPVLRGLVYERPPVCRLVVHSRRLPQHRAEGGCDGGPSPPRPAAAGKSIDEYQGLHI